VKARDPLPHSSHSFGPLRCDVCHGTR
jgi:hypothetical protein